ncbi:MAG TPA: anthranilate synthase component I [Candidatus Omnitrophica bacterium]|nr:anthranilate synthase component I [Candidatus Omnitrophota bacterium]
MRINPSFKEFISLAKKHNLIVFSYKFYSDWINPVSSYYGLSKNIKRDSFLLESVEGEEKVCRFSFLGFCPLYIFKTRGKDIFIEKNKKVFSFQTKKHPLYELKRLMQKFKVAPKKNLRFFGGFVGYLGYDIIRFYEPIGEELFDPLDTYDIYLILPKFLIIFDHLKREIEILSFSILEEKKDLRKIYFQEKDNLEKIYKKIIQPYKLSSLAFSSSVKVKVKSNFKKRDFLETVKKAKKYIKEGEIIQLVLSQNFSLEFKGDPFLVYRYLRILNPSPYMFYLNFSDVKLCGSSPEMLLRCEKGILITHPIAGTRKRGENEEEDKKLEESLINDPKERAEHIMLLDLARNDLGRVAKEATVEVPVFMKIERFSYVMHIVSEVRAKLKKGINLFEALISCFPAGTVSGAPKVRAMQIINELEPHKRTIYAGCVGYFSFTNSFDTCIIIRTIIFKNNCAYVQAGAGIVNDSKPLNEYKEIINKAKAAILAVILANK